MGIATHTAFVGVRQLAHGPLREVLTAVKQHADKDRNEIVLLFELATGRQVDFDLRGSLEDMLEREAPLPTPGPGRPRLGVTSREVTLLPRHWEWLEQQQSGISGALRRLVEQAMKTQPDEEHARRVRDALGRILSALAGDRPRFEEATRALFAADLPRFERLIERWPKDLRQLAINMAREALPAAGKNTLKLDSTGRLR